MARTALFASLSVTAPAGEALWLGDDLTPYGMETYTEGDCWALAWHVAQLLKPTLGSGLLYTLGRKASWRHVVVKVGEDLFLDALGLHTGAEVEAEWGHKLVPVPQAFEKRVGAYQAYLDTDFVYRSGHSEANRIAVLLVDKYCFDL